MNPIALRALDRARGGERQRTFSSRRYWTNREMDVLKELYPYRPGAEIAEQLNRPLSSIYAKAKELGVSKSPDFLKGPLSGRLDGVRGSATRFQKGHTTWNAGKSVPTRGRAGETQFSKGQMPHNHVPVGTEVMATIGYLKIKVAEPNQWEFVHRRNWEAVHGPIPKGMTLIFRSPDRGNCSVDNLELVTRSDLMTRNSIHRYPPELKSAIRLLGQLNRTIEASHE